MPLFYGNRRGRNEQNARGLLIHLVFRNADGCGTAVDQNSFLFPDHRFHRDGGQGCVFGYAVHAADGQLWFQIRDQATGQHLLASFFSRGRLGHSA